MKYEKQETWPRRLDDVNRVIYKIDNCFSIIKSTLYLWIILFLPLSK
ncbi:MAG: hypothetical protein LBB34_01885 [Holosporales bacterium]|nr:hypothetical protein [Holosporales bacterium]